MTTTGRTDPIDRRSFLRAIAACGAAVAFGVDSAESQSLPADTLTIGIVLPSLAKNARSNISEVAAGIDLGLDEALRNAALFQKHVNVVRKPFAAPDQTTGAALDVISRSRATTIVGGGDEAVCRAIAGVC